MADAKPKQPSKARRALLRLRRFLAARSLSLCWGTYVLSIVWLLLHPAVTVTTGELKCRGTYMSENALLIDLMEARASHHEAHVARNFQKELLQLPGLPSGGCGDNCSSVEDWIGTQLRRVDRVEAYKHTFRSAKDMAERTNVYGILRASPLADGKEAIVLVTHYRNVGERSGEYSGLALGVAMLQYLAKAKWLAKDVILLAADDGMLDGSDGYAPGTEAWLQAYHLNPVERGLQGALPMRAGVIRAAVNLESMSEWRNVDTMGVYAAGRNGQLPNLDLVNTAVRASNWNKLPVVLDRADTKLPDGQVQRQDVVSSAVALAVDLHERFGPDESKRGVKEYLGNLGGMLHFMTTLATGPSGLHANFIRYNIDSITLSLTQRLPSSLASEGRGPLGVRGVLRAVEMVVRALSNLEERLHQSFFLYVLPSTTTFVSVGEYYYVVALAISPAVAHLFHLASRTAGMRVALALAVFLAAEALCVSLLALICRFFATDAALLSSLSASAVPSGQWWTLGVAISAVQALFVALVMPALRSIPAFSGCVEARAWREKLAVYEAEQQKKTEKDGEPDTTAKDNDKSLTPPSKLEQDAPEQDSGWRALKFLVMALLVFAHCILGILNYPMAFFCALPMAHFARVVPATTAPLSTNIWSALWLAVSSPLLLLALLQWIRSDAMQGVAFVVDGFVQHLNLLALPYVCCIYVAVHTLSLAIWFYPGTVQATTEKQKLE